MPDTPTIEPTEILQGDTAKWQRTFEGYSPADGWTLVYYFRGASNITVSGSPIVADGDAFVITIPAATTAGYTIGKYYFFARVSKSGEVYTVANGELKVIENPSAVTANFDGRTDIAKALDAAKAMLIGTASREEQELQVGFGGTTRALKLFDRADLIALVKFLEQQREQEIVAENLADGKSSGRRILTRFNSY